MANQTYLERILSVVILFCDEDSRCQHQQARGITFISLAIATFSIIYFLVPEFFKSCFSIDLSEKKWYFTLTLISILFLYLGSTLIAFSIKHSRNEGVFWKTAWNTMSQTEKKTVYISGVITILTCFICLTCN